MTDDIPSFKNIKTWKFPQAKYFEIYPHEIWLLKHFDSWAIDNNFDKQISHQTFNRALQTINIDQEAFSELHNFAQKLLNNKKVS
ncbi:hypothetical protein F8M41_008111 [Gigaspora margarita]|uniref:Uncharacterized protein n=1 Tax=Gigaspora margarita TaxID=4874 RepID=A0A8H3X6Z4_GIGMA|nr:hypothetical protein F8M41_008111 [Gigaspora margarita]